MIQFFIPGRPTGKGRPRVCRNVTYTPQKTRDYETLVKDTDRDNWMSANEAMEYGLVDKVIEKR